MPKHTPSLKQKINELVNDKKLSAQEVAEALNNSGVTKMNGSKWKRQDVVSRRWSKRKGQKPVRKKAAASSESTTSRKIEIDAPTTNDAVIIAINSYLSTQALLETGLGDAEIVMVLRTIYRIPRQAPK